MRYSAKSPKVPSLPTKASTLARPSQMAPNLLFYSVSDVRETDAGVAYGKVFHPPPQNRIDLVDHPADWLGYGVPKNVSELVEQCRPLLTFGNNSGIHRPRRLRIRRNSKPRDPKLSPCCKFTLRLLSLAVWPTPPGAASPPPAEAIAGADANPVLSENSNETGPALL
jgi:hypothetical protein